MISVKEFDFTFIPFGVVQETFDIFENTPFEEAFKKYKNRIFLIFKKFCPTMNYYDDFLELSIESVRFVVNKIQYYAADCISEYFGDEQQEQEEDGGTDFSYQLFEMAILLSEAYPSLNPLSIGEYPFCEVIRLESNLLKHRKCNREIKTKNGTITIDSKGNRVIRRPAKNWW